jgi:hypothetical protein
MSRKWDNNNGSNGVEVRASPTGIVLSFFDYGRFKRIDALNVIQSTLDIVYPLGTGQAVYNIGGLILR